MTTERAIKNEREAAKEWPYNAVLCQHKSTGEWFLAVHGSLTPLNQLRPCKRVPPVGYSVQVRYPIHFQGSEVVEYSPDAPDTCMDDLWVEGLNKRVDTHRPTDNPNHYRYFRCAQ